jgi:hypothetical protein
VQQPILAKITRLDTPHPFDRPVTIGNLVVLRADNRQAHKTVTIFGQRLTVTGISHNQGQFRRAAKLVSRCRVVGNELAVHDLIIRKGDRVTIVSNHIDPHILINPTYQLNQITNGNPSIQSRRRNPPSAALDTAISLGDRELLELCDCQGASFGSRDNLDGHTKFSRNWGGLCSGFDQNFGGGNNFLDDFDVRGGSIATSSEQNNYYRHNQPLE